MSAVTTLTRAVKLIAPVIALVAIMASVRASTASAEEECNIACHDVEVVTPGECWPGYHWAEGGGTDGGVGHKNPETCFAGTCANKHCCGGGCEGEGESEDLELLSEEAAVERDEDLIQAAAVALQDPGAASLNRVVAAHDGRIQVNASRAALQVLGCGGFVVGHFPLTPAQLRLAQFDGQARGSSYVNSQ